MRARIIQFFFPFLFYFRFKDIKEKEIKEEFFFLKGERYIILSIYAAT